MSTVKWVTFALVLNSAISFAQPPPPQVTAPVPAVLRNYQPVTAERLKKPEDGNWLMIRRTYDGWGYSPLKQITTSNVKNLKGFPEPRLHLVHSAFETPSVVTAHAQGQFDVFVTIDRGFEFEHNLAKLTFGIVIVRVPKNRIEYYRLIFPALVAAVERVTAGEVIHVTAKPV